MAEKLLTVRQVQTAGEGDHSDGAGLMLRVRGVSASWVLRYTGPSGRRREMGLGTARRSNSKDTGESLTAARDAAAKARAQVQQGIDPSTRGTRCARARRPPSQRPRPTRSASSSRWPAPRATTTSA
jgi:hypothetical protein